MVVRKVLFPSYTRYNFSVALVAPDTKACLESLIVNISYFVTNILFSICIIIASLFHVALFDVE